jgi:shikimate kinase
MERAEDLPVALIGIMGAGKSVTARALARLLGVPAVDLDREIERGAGRSVAELFAERGEEGFRDLEESALRRAASGGPRVIACGGGVVLRASSRALLRERCRTVWLEAEPAEAAERLSRTTSSRPLLAGGEPGARLADLLRARAGLYAEACHARVPTSGRSPEEVARAVAAALATVPGESR